MNDLARHADLQCVTPSLVGIAHLAILLSLHVLTDFVLS